MCYRLYIKDKTLGSKKKMLTEKNKYEPIPLLAVWLDQVDPPTKKMLGDLAGTSEAMYRQWVSGRRNLSAEKAGAIEAAMEKIYVDIPGAPKPLSRGDLCRACRNCRYFLIGEGAVTDDMDLLG